MAVRLLLEENAERAKVYAEELCEINRERQQRENKIAEEAYDMVEKNPDPDNDLVIVLAGNRWQQGIIGIVSSRITERYGLPSVLVSFGNVEDGEENPMDDGKGSGRSIKGMNLVEALAYCDDLLLRYGGHELAAGLTVKRENLAEFRRRINEYAREHLSEDVFQVRMEADCEVAMQDLTMDFAKEIQLLEPCGTNSAAGNSIPAFIMRDVTVRRIDYSRDGNHTILRLEKDGVCMTGMYYGVAAGTAGFEAGDRIDLFFNVEINDFRNTQSVQMIVKDARLSAGVSDRLASEKRRYGEIRAGAAFDEAENILPCRNDFARVYLLLRREYRSGTSVLDMRSLMRAVETADAPAIGYIKYKYILSILNELKICEIEEIGDDLYRFSVVFSAEKTSIDKSSILKKLKARCSAGSRKG